MDNRSSTWQKKWLDEKDGNGDVMSLWCNEPTNPSKSKAYCNACLKEILFGQHGVAALKSHAKSRKHVDKMLIRRTTSKIQVIKVASDGPDNANACTVLASDDRTTSAEVMWALHCIQNNYSFASSDDVTSLFAAMFPDSSVPKKMAMGRKKLAYVITDGILPHVYTLLRTAICDLHFSISVDVGSKHQNQYLGIVIRFIENDTWNLRVTCIDIPHVRESGAESLVNVVMEKLISLCGSEENVKRFLIACMTDNCNTMRGIHSGFQQRLKQVCSNIVDIGGCPLHHIQNVSRHGVQAFASDVEQLVSDIYCHFRFSNSEAEGYSRVASLMEVAEHRFLRHVEVRWLQLLPVVERVLEQMAPLKEFFQSASHRSTGARAPFIRDALLNPVTLCDLLFLQSALKALDQFETLFQSRSCLIHVWYVRMVELLRQWYIRFIKPSALAKPVWKTDVENKSIWLADGDILIGVATETALRKVATADRAVFISRVRKFYCVTAKFMVKYLPFGNPFLRAAHFLSPDTKSHPNFEKWLKAAAAMLPNVISPSNLDELIIEGREYQLLSINTEISDDPKVVLQHWRDVTTNRFPQLRALSQAMLTIPHGNADVERVFSNLPNIVTDKRTTLAPMSVSALTMIKTYMQTYNLTGYTFPITKALLISVRNANAFYKKRMEEEKKRDIDEENRRRTEFLKQRLDKEIATSSRINKLSIALSEVNVERQSEVEKLARARELRSEADKLMVEAEESLTSCRMKEIDLQKKKERESKRLLDKVLDTGEPSSKRVCKGHDD